MKEHFVQDVDEGERAGRASSGSGILKRYQRWFYAAAVYNFAWGLFNILFPHVYFDAIGMEPPRYLSLWQVVGMFVLVYAPAYWWVARRPDKYPHLIVIGLLGKLLGPAGFTWSVLTGQLPLAFGWTILTNDIIWWPAFARYLRDVARIQPGFRTLF